MELKIKDIVKLLNVSEKTVYRWIKENKIPCYKINHQYRFNRAEINEWILSNKIELLPSLINISLNQNNLSSLLEKGGVYYDIEGDTVSDVLRNAVNVINIPQNLSRENILSALLKREELMPTAIGKGIAIPHPRNPIITDLNSARVSICYLKNPVDFGSLDNEPVHTLFVLLTASPKMHLEVLSKVSYLCHTEVFLKMLKDRSPYESLLEFIRMKEKEWQSREAKV
ncbi:PTS sugar transporter subunit IIA [Rosettibacter firmus]|uniref:PTS sugar transporter subunit IIA n=1 Tax=Rosettibacter firmus TaxID=3111522 RepID=UPI00336C282A